MSRPHKVGLDYFPLDVGFLRDEKLKLIKGEFGALGILVYLHLISSIYEQHGYYNTWTDDVCILVSEEVGCGCNFRTIGEIVQGLIRRSLFDERVANTFGVLTSPGIQRRYLAAAARRGDIDIKPEYWLLNDPDDPVFKKLPASTRNKVALNQVNTAKTTVNVAKTAVNVSNNPQSKEKNICITLSSNTVAHPAQTPKSPLDEAMDAFTEMRKKIKKPLTDKGRQLTLRNLEKLAPGDEAAQIQIVEQSIQRSWQGVFPLKDDTAGWNNKTSGGETKNGRAEESWNIGE
jgi:hypothetical protein